jgi:hypothetical protein
MPRLPLQEEPESTVGRKPGRGFEHHPPGDGTPVRSGAAIRREEGDETEAGSEIRDREGDEVPTIRGLDE